jgi:hypothetical protein
MMDTLKKRWGINSNWQVIIILLVFTITGSTSVFIAKPVLDYFGITVELGKLIYWVLRILVIFTLYQILLVSYGWLFGQYKFFSNFVKKFVGRIGFGFLFKK